MTTRAVALTIPIVQAALAEVAASEAPLDLRDLSCPGLTLRIGRSGVAAWSLRYGAGGQRIPMGRFPALSLKQARDAAARHRQRIADGEDPRLLRREGQTLEDLAPRFLAQHVAQLAPRTQKQYEAIVVKRILPALGSVRVRDLDRAMVIRWHHSLGTQRYANFCLAVLSKFMSMAELWEERDGNPCKGVPRFPEGKRQRYLTPDEVGALAKVLDDSPAACGVRLLIFTGIRLGELLVLRWDWIDRETGTMTFPAEAHKSGRKAGAKTVPLNHAALAVLDSIPHMLGRSEVLPLATRDMERYWSAVRTAAKIPDVRLHDLRHTYASWGAARGLSLPVIGALLGHRNAATTQRYAHLAQGPLKEAVEKIGNALEDALKKAPEGA